MKTPSVSSEKEEVITKNEDKKEDNSGVPVSNSAVEFQKSKPSEVTVPKEDVVKDEVTVQVSLEERTLRGTYELAEDTTVYDVLVSLLEDNKVDYSITGGSTFAYVSSIGTLAERDYGPMSGWMYSVNGKQPDVGCGQYVLEKGDSVVWEYQKDG